MKTTNPDNLQEILKSLYGKITEQHAIDLEQALLAWRDKETIKMAEEWLELLRTLTPARPEDLDLSQWFALAEATKSAGDIFEEELAQLKGGSNE